MTERSGRDLLHRALAEYSSGADFAEPVVTVRRRIKRRQARTRVAAAVGALAIVTGGAAALGTVTPGSHTTATLPTATPTKSRTAHPTGPRVLRVEFVKAQRRVVVSRPWGSGPGAWGLLTGGDEADEGPSVLVTDGHGRLYLVDDLNNRLLAYSAATGRPLPDASATLPNGFYYGAAVDAVTGDVYVLNGMTSTLLRVSGGRVTAATPAHLDEGFPPPRYTASAGTVEALTIQGDAPQPRRATLLSAGVPAKSPRLRPVRPSLSAPALEFTDFGQLAIRFGPRSAVQPDFDAPVREVGKAIVAAPGVVWLGVRTESVGRWHAWLARVTPDGVVAMPLLDSTTLPYENQNATAAATAGKVFLLVGDASGGRIVEYVPGKPLRR